VIELRTELRPGDIGAVVRMHGRLYAGECGFDATFEGYVAAPLGKFAQAPGPRERIWLAERDGELVGCVAIVKATEWTAQLRWYLVDPSVRGIGLGRRLMDEALTFCRAAGYRTVFLWTVASLTTAAHVYRTSGFRVTERAPRRLWGVDVVEERYELDLSAAG
jgi:GNAT superfamily N-acetyltransferase